MISGLTCFIFGKICCILLFFFCQIQILRSNEKFGFKSGLALDPWAEPLPPSIIELETTSSSSNEEEEGGGIVLSTKTSHHPDQNSQTEQDESSSAPAPSPSSSKRETGSSKGGGGGGGRISVPFLVINSEAFTLWKPHYYQVREIVESVNNNAQSWFFTIRTFKVSLFSLFLFRITHEIDGGRVFLLFLSWIDSYFFLRYTFILTFLLITQESYYFSSRDSSLDN